MSPTLALPNIGCILRERDDGKLRLDLDAFKKYLQLLEMVVLHERLIVAAPNRDEFLEPEEFDSLIASHLLALFRRRGSLHLTTSRKFCSLKEFFLRSDWMVGRARKST